MGELQERLRRFAQGCRGSMWQSRDETIRLMDEAADELDRLTAERDEQEAEIERLNERLRRAEERADILGQGLARLRAKLELTPENVGKAARAMALDANDYEGPELQWSCWTDSATAAIKSLGSRPMTMAEQAYRMAKLLDDPMPPHHGKCKKAAALLRQCAEALRKEVV